MACQSTAFLSTISEDRKARNASNGEDSGYQVPKEANIAVMPASGDLRDVLEAARKRSPMKLEDLTPEDCEAVPAGRAKAAPPPREPYIPRSLPRPGMPK